MMSLSQKWTMTLTQLIADFGMSDNCPDVSIEGIALDSRQVQPGDLFIAIKGTAVDGFAFIPQAIERGAVAVLVEKDQLVGSLVDGLIDGVNTSVPVIGVENLSEYVSDIAGVFYADPSAKICLTAITGTNGKTTCSRLFAELMESLASERAGTSAFIGTLGYGMVCNADYKAPHDSARQPDSKEPGMVTDTGLTTPDAVVRYRSDHARRSGHAAHTCRTGE